MQLHIWYYYIIDKIQSEYLVQVFSIHYWVNRLNIAINSVSKYGKMSETTKGRNSESNISYLNREYLGAAYFE